MNALSNTIMMIRNFSKNTAISEIFSIRKMMPAAKKIMSKIQVTADQVEIQEAATNKMILQTANQAKTMI